MEARYFSDVRLHYAEKYIKEKEKDGDNFYAYGHLGQEARLPNGTIIRESLKMVGRMANIVANEVVLSNYSKNKIFK